MQYRTLGRTGVQISTLALGAMNFGAIGRTTQEEATAIVDAALEAGVNVIDTADMYGTGESEEMVGKAIAGRRDDIVLATKATMPMGRSATTAAARGAGSTPRWTTACAVSASTTWTSTRCTAGTRRPVTRRPCRPSPTCSARARSAPSAPRPSLRTASCRRSGPPVSTGSAAT